MDEPTVVRSASHLVAGRDYPTDLAQFRAWFPTDEACLDYLDFLCWPDGFWCPHCGSRRASGGVGRYRCTGYDRRVSVTAGTVLDKTRTPLTVWFETAWLMVADKTGVSAPHRTCTGCCRSRRTRRRGRCWPQRILVALVHVLLSYLVVPVVDNRGQ